MKLPSPSCGEGDSKQRGDTFTLRRLRKWPSYVGTQTVPAVAAEKRTLIRVEANPHATSPARAAIASAISSFALVKVLRVSDATCATGTRADLPLDQARSADTDCRHCLHRGEAAVWRGWLISCLALKILRQTQGHDTRNCRSNERAFELVTHYCADITAAANGALEKEATHNVALRLLNFLQCQHSSSAWHAPPSERVKGTWNAWTTWSLWRSWRISATHFLQPHPLLSRA